jgi:tRNA A-37 threonylcarbamoyl transferase component Bud32
MSTPDSRVPADSAEATRYLQDSIAGFARIVFALSGAMLIAGLVVVGVLGLPGRTMHQHAWNLTMLAHVTAQVVLLAVWLRCRGSTLKLSTLVAVDAALTIFLCTCWALLGLGVPANEPIEFPILLAITHTLIARSIYVPSSFGHTLWVSAVGVLPTIAVIAHRGMGWAVGYFPGQARTFIVFSTLWCAAAAVMSAVNSRKLFGLRAQVREVGKLGQYTLQEKLGEGAMGVVYRATHAMLRRPAAIKLLHPERDGAKDLARFEREVQLTSRLTHPNTISIFDYGRTAEGAFYYVMEYLEGLDLEHLVAEEGPVPPARAARILAQAAGSLAEAHAIGLIHRDIKPANIMLTQRPDESDIVKVVDFGLVKTLRGGAGDASVTNVDAITGTPLYLAPEAITSPDTVGPASDIYALGAVGYFLITGRHVFEAPRIVEVLSKHLHAAPEPLAERLGRPVPEDLAALIMSCLAKRPEDRPASAGALRTGLMACADFARYDDVAATAWWRDRGAALRAKASAVRVEESPVPERMVKCRWRDREASPPANHALPGVRTLQPGQPIAARGPEVVEVDEERVRGHAISKGQGNVSFGRVGGGRVPGRGESDVG